MTDQRTLKNIINEQRKTITQLETTCKEFAIDLDETIRVAAETIREHQTEYEMMNRENIEFSKRNAALENAFEAANKILDIVIEKCQYNYDVDTCEKCCDKKCCEEYEMKAILIPRSEQSPETPELSLDASEGVPAPLVVEGMRLVVAKDRGQDNPVSPRKEEANTETCKVCLTEGCYAKGVCSPTFKENASP